jgi:hypothetical protein
MIEFHGHFDPKKKNSHRVVKSYNRENDDGDEGEGNFIYQIYYNLNQDYEESMVNVRDEYSFYIRRMKFISSSTDER